MCVSMAFYDSLLLNYAKLTILGHRYKYIAITTMTITHMYAIIAKIQIGKDGLSWITLLELNFFCLPDPV